MIQKSSKVHLGEVQTENEILTNTFCTSPFTFRSPSIGTILQTVFPALKASPYVPSPTLVILSASLDQESCISLT